MMKETLDTTARSNPAERLINAVQELSLARDLATVMEIVRRAARELTGADGATFVLRDRDQCYYVEENAIEPLWKGKRFPMSACISGWAMLNKQSAVIEDIYADPRIPADAYRPTFVKSLAMVPIRVTDPVGAIGNYWAAPHKATEAEVKLLQALANSTSIAMENVQLYGELEQRVQERTAQLEAANQELEAFSYSVSHDLRAPLRHMEGFSKLLLEKSAGLGEDGRDYLQHIRSATARMGQLIDDLLKLSRVSRAEIVKESVDLSQMAGEIAADLRRSSPAREVEFAIAEGVTADGDPRLLRVAMENLLSNAWKYTSKKPRARISFGCKRAGDESGVYFVQDDGAGFDMAYAGKLFAPFQRLHADSEFSGTGIGLATVARIIHKHGGHIRAEAAEGKGAIFSFTLA
jgi:signal transduction histidine kinase